VDLSARQLAFGRDLVREHGVNVAFLQADLQGLPLAPGAAFDLIHSSFALPFLPNPVAALSQALRHLKPGGHLVLATIHPLATAEWLTVDEDEDGIFLPDYYHPPVDTRHDDADDAVAVCRPLPVSTVFGLLRAQELEVEALLEPPALPVDQMAETEIRERVPYESEAWRELAARFRRVPFALVIRARKPDRVRA
jgi:SAM-dependent methyltransferase